MRDPKFNSAFAPMMHAFCEKREQEGYNNKNQIYYLEEFDRLIMQSGFGSIIVDSELIELWDSYKPHLSNRTKISRHNIIRSFCEYLYEHDHCSFVPDRSRVSEFLDWLENTRNASVSTRNQRLAALKAFSKYAQYRYPDTITNCVDIITMRPKKQEKPLVAYLSEEELSVLLKQPNPMILHELRDLALMSLLYDTGARVQELVDLTLGDIRLAHPAMVILTGKGQKSRQIPLMKETCRLMDRYISRFHPPKAPKETPLFYNRDKKPLTRYGVTYILKKYAKNADTALDSKIISPHVLRHTKAMHLLRAGVNMIYTRDFLGHVEITTTEVYARIDAEMKRKVFEETVPNYIPEAVMPWEEDEDLLEWLTHFGKKTF